MRRIALAIATTAAVIALLFSYRTSSVGPTATGNVAAASAHIVAGGTSNTSGSDPTTTGSATTPASPGAPTSTRLTVDGKLVQTGYGPIVVEVVVTDGTISDAQAVTYPNAAGRTESISANALPILRSEALKKQGADIDGVSGATHTSDGYIASLQSALDLVGLK